MRVTLIAFAATTILAPTSRSQSGVAFAVEPTTSTTTIPDDYLTLFPSGVPTDYPDQMPATGLGSGTFIAAIVILSTGTGMLSLRRRLTRSAQS